MTLVLKELIDSMICPMDSSWMVSENRFITRTLLVSHTYTADEAKTKSPNITAALFPHTLLIVGCPRLVSA